MEKLIITIAPLGNVPTKELNPNTPITAVEITDNLERCREMGAAIAHIHVRDDEGKPTSDREKFKEVLDEIEKRKLDMITQLSTGARGGANTPEWRSQMLDLNIEMASLATGSSNFPTSVNANSPELIEHLINKMNANGVKPEIEAFDLAMIDNASYLAKKGVLKSPLHFNLVMNVPGSAKGTPRNLLHMVESLPVGSTWSVTAIGKAHIPLLTMAIAMGGNIRTGLEDILEIDKGVKESNYTLMERVVNIAKAVGRPIATPDEAREILSLK
ncbi:MAG: 3-keto-5-aminohexanoate cleavage protein [Clostridiaceae bacterium]|nr:3-keto-5-aminohexanoate cleavage protein [Clostridiaceae bacterium]